MTGHRALLRLARREIRRHPARSALVFLLIALMVGASTAAATAVRNVATNETDRREATFGDAVARIDFHERGPYPIGHEGEVIRPDFDPRDIDTARLAAEVDAVTGGSAQVVRRSAARMGSGIDGPFTGYARLVELTDLDLRPGGLAAFAELRDGQAPVAPDQVALSTALMESNGWTIGDTADIAGQDFTIVGSAVKVLSNDARLGVLTPEGFDRIAEAGASSWNRVDAQVEVYLDQLGPDRVGDARLFDVWPDLEAAVGAATGATGESFRLAGRSFDGYLRPAFDPAQRPEQLGTLMAIALAIQVALVAAAAFAVGVRRRTRDFGQLLVTGADHGQLRLLVLLEAAVLGVLGAVVGVIGGVGVVWWANSQGWLAELAERNVTDLRWNVVDWLGPFAIGVAAAVAAAWWPTGRLRSLSPNAALSDHLPLVEPTTRSAVAGLGAVAAGTILLLGMAQADWLLYGSTSLGPAFMVVAVLLIFCGALALIGNVIAWCGRRADGLPLRPRLVVRNSARHQVRSWMAVGAFVATMVVPVLLGSSVKAYPGSYGLAGDESGQWVVLDAAASRGTVVSFSSNGAMAIPISSAGLGSSEFDSPPPVSLERFRATLGAGIADLDGFESSVSWDTIAISGLVRTGPTNGNQVQHHTIGAVVAVAEPELAAALGVAPHLLERLDERSALVIMGSRKRALRGATEVTLLEAGESQMAAPAGSRTVSVTQVDGGGAIGRFDTWVLVSRSLAEALDEPIEPGGTLWKFEDTPSEATEARIETIANSAWQESFGPWEGHATRQDGSSFVPSLRVGDPTFASPSGQAVQWTGIAITAGVAALIALITAALAAVELDKEIGSMIASGARPSIRRWLLAAQTTYHLGLAAVIGIPLGILLFWAATRSDAASPRGLVFPWTSMAAMGLVVPVVVGLCVAILFRNGRPAVSRRLS